MREVWEAERESAEVHPERVPRRVAMHFVDDPTRDRRRYNAPTANEVAVVFVGDDGRPPRNLDLVVYDTNPNQPGYQRQNIPSGSGHADPMLYPLFFPYGEKGWTFNTLQEGVRRNRVRTRISIREFAGYRMAIRYRGNNDTRHREFSLLHGGGFLFQQYVCDQYVRMEANNLAYVDTHQTQLFADAYQGLMDHVNQNHDLNAPDLGAAGRRVILPSTFAGSPRYMKQCYHDAMAIVRKYGKPDLFITFTCNPRWPEIQQNLARGRTANDRPDLVARVFHVKLTELMRDITTHRIFGNVDAYVYTVEFQKRGLPHAHILIILREDCKLQSADDVDNVVRACLPDPETERRLHVAVSSHMIHGPCGPLNINSQCMVDGSCSKKYPKEYSDETVFRSDGGYPTYRRPENGRTVNVRNHEVGNEFVVPHNPFLLAKYDAHINVEVCSTVKSVMYLYKYVYKGHDAATLAVWNANEIEG